MRWLSGMVFVAWVAVGYQPLKFEYGSLKRIGTLWRMDSTEKKRQIDGPLYGLMQKASDTIPPSANEQVYVFAVDSGVTYYRLAYYLYPSTVHLIDPAQFVHQELPVGSYFVFYIPSRVAESQLEEVKRNWDAVAKRLPAMATIFEASNAGIYKVSSSR